MQCISAELGNPHPILVNKAEDTEVFEPFPGFKEMVWVRVSPRVARIYFLRGGRAEEQ